MKITIKEVAKAAGVSVATASMALNNREGTRKATRERVLRVAKELNYVPNYSARALVMQDSDCIGLMIPEIQNPFYNAIVDILTRIVEQKGYSLLLGITNNSSSQEAEYVRMFLSRRVCGVIIVPVLQAEPDASHLDLLRAADIPIVFCTEIYRDCSEPAVMCDFAGGEYAATKFLIDKGLRDFWFISSVIDAHFTHERRMGYLQALREAGIPERKDRELRIAAPQYAEAYRAADRILADRSEAVICINDIMSMAIMKRMNECGIHIPADISIIGFDDILFSELVSPPLTTVRQPVQAICEKTMELLERKLHGETVDDGGICRIRPELIVRGTTV